MRLLPTSSTLVAVLALTACVVELPDRAIGDGNVPTRDGVSKTDKKQLDPNCGNAKLDAGERCDVAIGDDDAGACPKSCDDGLACTDDAVQDADTCAATCTFTPISTCKNGDGCCPGGCDFNSDDDCSKDCGNGTIDDKETCDTKIPAGQAGACPTVCDDKSTCTKDVLLNGGGCSAQCTFNAIKTCTNGDGCCPTGCNTGNDDDCSPGCGNSVLDKGEKCDTGIAKGQPGACPTGCDDGKACTTDTLLNTGTCNAQCQSAAIQQCKSGDNCCPTGCNNNSDTDCSASCGNGAIEGNEKCDKGIAAGKPGACPTACDDKDSCTSDSLLNPGTCNAQCSFSNIQQCKNGDGCCPSGCHANNDNDCSATCNNGVVEPPELCDTKITSGAGKCPTSCNDGQACTIDTLQNGSTCSAKCVYTTISSCKNGDGCCPSGCNANNDNNCNPVCGNNVVESGEKCDGNCPTSCSVPTCKTGGLVGTGCQRECSISNASNGTTCPSGKCYGGSCCTGCWTGSTCAGGGTKSTCGKGGISCINCPAPACKNAVCNVGVCGTNDKVDGASCSGGKCYGGSCCTGCWDGNSCEPGTTSTKCGDNGASCGGCVAPVCNTASCSTGSCVLSPASEGTTCTGGRCRSGSCCTGCWNGFSCEPGDDEADCGKSGLLCKDCGGVGCCDFGKCFGICP